MNPNYRYPLPHLFKIAGSLIPGRSRSFGEDSRRIFSHQPHLLMIHGEQYVPQNGSCVVTFNHFFRPKFNAWWLALAVSAAIPHEIHWIVTRQLNQFDKWYGFLARPASRWALGKFSKMYGFTLMPPMPPLPEDAGERACAVREVLTFARKHDSPLIGLAPEGRDEPGGVLGMPAPGLGRFCLLLASMGISFSPIGIYESDGCLHLNFGPQYDLQVPSGLSSKQKDRKASGIIMKNIANLLPVHLRGIFV